MGIEAKEPYGPPATAAAVKAIQAANTDLQEHSFAHPYIPAVAYTAHLPWRLFSLAVAQPSCWVEAVAVDTCPVVAGTVVVVAVSGCWRCGASSVFVA